MASSTNLNLLAVNFTGAETDLLQQGRLRASAFRYRSGVAALRIRNAAGELVLLPIHGQQIWDANFHGRRLTMRSMFTDPVNTTDYLSNYGAFLVHCGVAAMGNPGQGDSHPLHGEIPNAPYQEAELSAGEDEHGAFMELGGRYRHTVAFTHNHVAEPRLRFRENSGRVQMSLRVENLKGTPMDLMYLAHVNFRPVDGATLVDTASNDPRKVRIRTTVPGFFKPTESHRAFIEALQKDPSLHRKVEKGRPIDPELVMGLDYRANKDGWAHSMQVLPDGSADFISHRPSELPKGVRWMTRTANQDALGLYLPATAEADGYTAEKAKGNIITLPPGGEFSCHLELGALLPGEAKSLVAQCRS